MWITLGTEIIDYYEEYYSLKSMDMNLQMRMRELLIIWLNIFVSWTERIGFY